MSRPYLSVVIPVFNEEGNLPILAGEIVAALEDRSDTYEVLFVDDGSTDGSPAALAALAADDPRIRILRLDRNRGQSAALTVGFRQARGELTATLDGDLQNDPADLPRLLEALGDGWDVVCGVRQKRRDSWVRRISSRIANGVRNRLTAESIADVGCTLRVYRTEYLRDLPMFDGMHRFLPTLLRLHGARIRELPVNHRPRLHGVPKYNIRNRIWRALVDLFAVRWMQRRWIDPRAFEEVACSPRRSGSPSGSSARVSSSVASSCSGSRRSAAGGASSPPPSGSSPSEAG